ncbi:MAG: solute:sodium symporter family transporter [bacterium]|nr:solute:sodium symporter family transporter [bacterium]
MALSTLDIVSFVGFLAIVIGISLYASRKEDTSEDYFLAGRNLSWWLIGFSLIASNISTEHFVGMAGKGYELGLAIASYEWMAAVTLVVVALVFLPKFLRSGIYTIPEYLEYRYSAAARAVMAGFMMVAYIFVALASVLYSGALALKSIFGINLFHGIWLIGILAGVYTIYGGLKAVVWSDLLQGSALLLGGIFVTILAFNAVGGVGSFLEASGDKLHTVLPWNHPEMPWVAVFIGGLWIPNIFYWGLNQFITQRTLGARSLAEGQKGILFAAGMKLLIPFIIVFPGIMAYQLYGAQIPQADQAYPFLIKNLLPMGFRGVMFAALFGAVMSSLDSMLNSASTIFTIDLFKRHWKKDASSHSLVTVGRVMTGVFVVLGCLWAPIITKFGSVYEYIQKIWGFISPGIVAAFVFGIVIRKAPPAAAVGAMILGAPVYGLCLFLMPDVAFLHHMSITFVVLVVYMGVVTILKPLSEPRVLPVNNAIELTALPSVKIWGAAVVLATVVLYIIFW